jgi:hypothetical protein
MSWFGSLFTGASPELNTLIGQYSQVGGSQVGQGQKNQNTASSFWNSILSGDSTKTSQALAPEISALKTSTAQDQKTASMFGPRSGGTAASNAAASDKAHGYIADLIGKLTNSSASSLASLGTSQVGTGLESLGMEQAASAERMQNWSDSILGLGLTKGAGFAEGAALNWLGKKMGMSSDNAST